MLILSNFKFCVRKFMNLFTKLLLAPAVLALLSPLSIKARGTNTPTIDDYSSEEQECIIYATQIRKKLVPPQYSRSSELYPKHAGLCTFNTAYDECMKKFEK